MAASIVPIPLYVILPLFIWAMIWKGIALWKAGRNNHLAWFVALFIVNTLGILPIIYLLWFQEKPLMKQKVITRTRKAVKKPARRKKR